MVHSTRAFLIGVGAFALLAAAPAAVATEWLTDEIHVNTYVTGYQGEPVVAVDAAGNFVVAWSGAGLHDSDGVFARLFDAAGAPVTDPLPVNTYTTDVQNDPSVAMAPDGRFVIAWESNGQDGDSDGVFARRFYPDGTARDIVEFQVSEVATDQQLDPDVAMGADGSFVVVWEAFPNFDGSAGAVYLRRFRDDGTAVAGDDRVNVTVFDGQRDPVVAMALDGRFAVAWESASQDFGSTWGIFTRIYNETGTAVTGEVAVNSYVENDQRDPEIQMNGAGELVVVWHSDGQDGDSSGAYARSFESSGVPATGELEVNLVTVGWQGNPAAAVGADGQFAVAFEDAAGSNSNVRVQEFSNRGAMVGAQYITNIYGQEDQDTPQIAANGAGRVIVTWESFGQDGSGNAVIARVGFLEGVFADGFETSDMSRWDAAQP